MRVEPKEELKEGLKHCLCFRGPVLMDPLMTLRNDVNQLKAVSRPVSNRDDFEDSSKT